MGMSTAGAGNCIDAATTGRLAGDALGAMAAPANYTASFSAYNPPGDPGGVGQGRRWGDYSYTAVDPVDDMSMWTIQMFCQATNNYACQVIKMLAPLPAAAVSATDVEAGRPSTMSDVVGTSTGGSGFFDPGPNLPGGVPGVQPHHRQRVQHRRHRHAAHRERRHVSRSHARDAGSSTPSGRRPASRARSTR